MSDDIAIKVDGVSKAFRLPHEKSGSIKNALVGWRKRKRGYETQRVLKDVSFEIKKGEFFGIVGRNGSGKSTLLKLISQIYTPDKGHIQVNGKLTPFIELGVGFNPELSGRDNVYLNGALLGFNRQEMDAMYDEIVDFAELHGFMDQKLKNYSSGMQVRLAFSIAIRADTDILVLDEVLAVGDMVFQEKCYQHFEKLKEAKKTIVFVSHDLRSVRRFCDRVLLINKSVQVACGDTEDMLEKYEKLVAEQTHQDTPNRTMGYHVGTGDAFIEPPKIGKKNYRVGEDIDITCNFELRKEGIKSVRLLFSLFSEHGGKLVSVDKQMRIKSGKTQAIGLTLKDPVLLPGVYTVNIGVFDDALTIAYDQYRECVRIVVVGENPRLGSIDQAVIWKD